MAGQLDHSYQHINWHRRWRLQRVARYFEKKKIPLPRHGTLTNENCWSRYCPAVRPNLGSSLSKHSVNLERQALPVHPTRRLRSPSFSGAPFFRHPLVLYLFSRRSRNLERAKGIGTPKLVGYCYIHTTPPSEHGDKKHPAAPHPPIELSCCSLPPQQPTCETITIRDAGLCSPTMAEFVRSQIFGTTFEITSRYTDLQPVGMGAFGLVCAARDQLTNQSVAIKKIMKPFSTPVLAKRTYRELKLLKHLRHENIISLNDIFISPLEDIYFVTELLGTDLHRLLTSRPLESQFIQYFLYQIMRGLKYVHSAGVVHRDLKPSNILVNENCDLKICDFGLARIQDPQMTGYVSTRYYRAPEIMLTWQKYDVEVDIWSAGCIFAEMMDGKPLFPGKDHVHQFSIITELLGTPPDDVINTIASENARKGGNEE
ncbi:hypothetical protein VTJ04DRAFT_5552 [Mycothermus thermophilus]|uniref:uncharacterized protein n=1 Tax=Humicola insolens TaxID=85995 RepID=UPI003742616E